MTGRKRAEALARKLGVVIVRDDNGHTRELTVEAPPRMRWSCTGDIHDVFASEINTGVNDRQITDHEYVERRHNVCDACEQPEDEHHSCEKPCDYSLICPMCSDYWDRMVDEGFWNVERREWTNKGYKEFMK